MNIRVACFALRRCSFEIDVDEPDAWIRRFMASDTFRGRMSALQSKPRLGVVEPRELFPRLGRMAGLAPERLSIRSCLPHRANESPLVGVGVTTCASQVSPVVNHRRLRLEVHRFLMSIAAGNRQMTPTQPKWRFVVPAQAECGWQKALQTMAALTGIEVRCGGKLSGVLVPVAVRAALELHLVERVFALRNMTLRALQRGMLALQRIGGRRVLL